MKEYKKIIEQLEDLEDIRLYDQAKREDDGERVLFDKYLKNRKKGK